MDKAGELQAEARDGANDHADEATEMDADPSDESDEGTGGTNGDDPGPLSELTDGGIDRLGN